VCTNSTGSPRRLRGAGGLGRRRGGGNQRDDPLHRAARSLREHLYPDATSCGEFTTSSNWSPFDGYRALLGQQPGVKTHYPSGGGLAGQTYEIDGWHPGTGDVFATRELAWVDGTGGNEPAAIQIRLDLIRQPSS
jgi:hypothetical protein